MAQDEVWSGPYASKDAAEYDARNYDILYESDGDKFVARAVSGEWYVYRIKGKEAKSA